MEEAAALEGAELLRSKLAHRKCLERVTSGAYDIIIGRRRRGSSLHKRREQRTLAAGVSWCKAARLWTTKRGRMDPPAVPAQAADAVPNTSTSQVSLGCSVTTLLSL